MWIVWEAKLLQFQHQGKDILLKGIQGNITQVEPISLSQLFRMEQENAVAHVVQLCAIDSKRHGDTHMPAEISTLLDEFHLVFSEPTELPKHREWDHAIPLLPGAKPVNIRPYRYTPE